MVEKTWAYRLISPATLKRVEVPITVDLEVEEVEVELLAAGICGTDILDFKQGPGSEDSLPGFPIHECVGVVCRDPKQDLKGQLVLAIPKEHSGLKGKYVSSRDHCHRLGQSWSRNDPRQLAIATLVQPLATVLFALDRCGDLQGKTVVSVGTGPIGLLFGLAARVRGARRVIGIDPRFTVSDVSKFGYDEIVADEGVLPASSFDLCIEAVGQEMTIVTAIRLCCRDGRVLAFGVPSGTHYQLPFEDFFRKRLTLTASVRPQWSRYLLIAEEFIRFQYTAVSDLVSHILPISRTQEGFDLVASSAPTRRKVVLVT